MSDVVVDYSASKYTQVLDRLEVECVHEYSAARGCLPRGLVVRACVRQC